MELRRYFQIILRYWWLVLILVIVGVVAAYQYYTSNRPTYTNTITVNITRNPTTNDTYSGYYGNISSEYLTDDYVTVIRGSTFLTDVSNLLKTRNISMSVPELQGAIKTERKNRQIFVTASNNDKGRSLAINRAVAETLLTKAGTYLSTTTGPQSVQANLLDFPTDAPLSGGRTLLLAAIRPLIGLIIGLALAFLLAYLDNSIRTARDVKEFLNLPVLAAVPKPGGRRTPGPTSRQPVNAAGETNREQVARR